METPVLDASAVPALTAAPDWAYTPFRTAAVLGAGVMGSQIAAHFANAGLQVLLLDVTPQSIGRAGRANDIVEAAFKSALKLNPEPFFSDSAKQRVTLGNLDDDFHRISEADWVVEVVVERMDVKQEILARVEEHARPDAVVSSNTSGLPIGEIARGRSEQFRRRFLGTHFFNPPRYLKLFEVIPTPDTDPDVLARVSSFARVHLGKGVVVAKDTPNFIGNRIGIYAMMRALRQFTDGGYAIEEIDALTGELVGHAKSATFRTADVVGLDTLLHVTNNLYEGVADDESREAFSAPDVLRRLVEAKRLGQKTRAGFYKKEGDVIRSVNPESLEYADPRPPGFDVRGFRSADLGGRMEALYTDDGRAGAFFRDTTLDLLAYAARRIPEVADSPADIDRAIRWGFGWEMGPFETWDALGFARLRDDIRTARLELPEWVDDVPDTGYYSDRDATAWIPPAGSYRPDPRPADEWGLAILKKDDSKTIWKNDSAALLDAGEGVALFEFRSKANALGQELLDGLAGAMDRVESDRDLRGMIIGNEGTNFSVGANLAEIAMAGMMGQIDEVGSVIEGFQRMVLGIRYAPKPVVLALHQRVLGGACEMSIACPHPVAAAESYLGLIELGVGLIPAGGGSMLMAAKASESAADAGRPSEVQPFLRRYFEQVATAKVATSAVMAREMGYLSPEAVIVMNAERRFDVARREVVRLSDEGYRPPPVRTAIRVQGATGRAQFEAALHQFRGGAYISEYDAYLAQRLAWVMTGGDITGPADVHEDYLLELEREVFLSLLGEEKTRARIESILTTNKPLRN